MKVIIYNPGGNVTALVEGLVEDASARQAINYRIMAEFPEVEQVGFLGKKPICETESRPSPLTHVPRQQVLPQLLMAGGEFCGNAARCAAWHLLSGETGEITLLVCDGNQAIRAGVSPDGYAWSEIPLIAGNPISALTETIYEVRLQGICHLVVRGYQPVDALAEAKQLIHKYGIEHSDCLGVVFTDDQAIYPVVWVKAVDTWFCETACGSGTTAVAMVEAMSSGKSLACAYRQPSGMYLEARVLLKNGQIRAAHIFGVMAEQNQLEIKFKNERQISGIIDSCE